MPLNSGKTKMKNISNGEILTKNIIMDPNLKEK